MTTEEIYSRITHFTGVSEVDAFIFRAFGNRVDTCCCNNCGRCDYINTHRYGVFEAQRWAGKYIYYCPLGFIFISVVMNDEGDACVSGPIIMGDLNDFIELPGSDMLAYTPNLSTQKVNHCAELLQILFCSEADDNRLLNDMYDILDEIRVSDYSYPIELEKKLQNAIISGNEKNSREYLNLLLGHIFFSSNADFNIIKHRVIELIVLLSRAAIERGADIAQILMLNTDYFLKIETIKNMDELSAWLTKIITRFIGYVFEFVDVKHADTIHKTVQFIKAHYNEKLTLDVICQEVSLSKAYLSKIFNSEMNCSITHYINKVRIQKSKPLLLDERIGIIEVAGMVGFEDQSYFSKVFKKIEGISPGKYREIGVSGSIVFHKKSHNQS